MKTERKIFFAFILNLFFAVFEFVGGVVTGSVAIISDALHDLGDATGIGVSYFLEKKSKRKPDAKFTYGYSRYSVIASATTILILIIGSVVVIYNAIVRILNPTQINSNGMIIFAVVGITVNLAAAIITSKGSSLNQKAVNLHMFEDVLGWLVVLIGAVVIRFTGFVIIDPIMSILVAVFILISAIRALMEILSVLLEKTPHGVELEEMKKELMEINGVIDVHHVHVWSMDGERNYATLHIVANGDWHEIKHEVRHKLKDFGIVHVTIELESEDENCHEKDCNVTIESNCSGHHHHHHHHHEHH